MSVRRCCVGGSPSVLRVSIFAGAAWLCVVSSVAGCVTGAAGSSVVLVSFFRSRVPFLLSVSFFPMGGGCFFVRADPGKHFLIFRFLSDLIIHLYNERQNLYLMARYNSLYIHISTDVFIIINFRKKIHGFSSKINS